MSTTQKLIDFAKNYCYLYFERRDMMAALALCAEDIIQQDSFLEAPLKGKNALMEEHKRRLYMYPGLFNLKYLAINAFVNQDSTGAVFLSLLLDDHFYLHMTILIGMEDGELRIIGINYATFSHNAKAGNTNAGNTRASKKSDDLYLKVDILNHPAFGGVGIYYNELGYPMHYLSQQLCEYLGYEAPEELIVASRNNAFSHVHPDDLVATQRSLQAQLEKDDSFTLEYRALKKDGSFSWVYEIGTRCFCNEGRELINFTCIDIQFRKTKEQDMHKLMEGLLGGFSIVHIDNDNKVAPLFFSDTLCKYFGKTREELMVQAGNEFYKSMHPDDRDRVKRITNASMYARQDYAYEYRIASEDGSYQWISVSSQITTNEDGSHTYYIVSTDITKQKEAYSKLQNFYDNFQGGIVKCNLDSTWTVVESNQRFYDDIQYTMQDFSERFNNSFLALFCSDYVEDFLKNVSTQLAENGRINMEICIQGGAKRKIPMWICGEPDKDMGGTHLYITLTDLTALKMEEQKVLEATTGVVDLFQTMPGGLFRCHLDEHFTLDFCNDGYYSLLEYTKEEVEGIFQNKLLDIVLPEDIPCLSKSIKEQLAVGTNANVSFRFTTKSGKIKWFDVSGELVTEADGRQFFNCCAIDRTEQNNMRRDLQITQDKLYATIEHFDIDYWEYNPKTGSAFLNSFHISGKKISRKIENFPEDFFALKIVHPDYENLFRQMHESIKAGETSVGAEILMFNGKGEEAWFNVRYTTLLDDDGKGFIALGTRENIGAYKELEHRFAVATEQTGISVWTYDILNKTITRDKNSKNEVFRDAFVENVPEHAINAGLIHPDDVLTYRQLYERLNEGEYHSNCDLRVKNQKTGSFLWMRLFYTVLPSENGINRTAVGTAIDISDKKKAEQHFNEHLGLWNLHSSVNLGSAVFNLTSNSVLSAESANIDFPTCNMTATAFFDKLSHLVVGAESKAIYQKIVNRENLLLASKQELLDHVAECRLMTMKKEVFWASFEIHIIKNPETHDIVAFVVISDITESTISNLFIDKLISNKSDFVAIIHLSTGTYNMFMAEHTKWRYTNFPFTGRFEDDIHGVTSVSVAKERLNPILDQFSLENLVARHVKEGDYDIFFELTRPGGEKRSKCIQIFARDEASNTICLGCMDITEMQAQEHRRNEVLSEALHAAQDANASKSSFLASMSHDIRTPMNAIIGMTTLAIEDIENIKQVSESLDIIKASSEHLLELLNDVLEMSRLESGKFVFNKESFSMVNECTKLHAFFKGIVIQKEQVFDFVCAEIKNDRVIGDAVRFNRIITNLLGNAVKFTQKGGSVSFKVEEILSTQEKIAMFRITVSDTGIGIAENQLKSIFEPFHREETSVVQRTEGSGLGLAIVKALVDGQGGDIRVESSSEGSIFILELPMQIDDVKIDVAGDRSVLAMADVDLKNVRILLVEDHEVNILVATKMLQKMGAIVAVARNGKEGLEMFCASEAGTYSFIFMDLQMPVLNGLESTQAIRASDHPEAKSIPIIAMTANAFADDVKKSHAAGMNYHISKPISVENICNALQKLDLMK